MCTAGIEHDSALAEKPRDFVTADQAAALAAAHAPGGRDVIAPYEDPRLGLARVAPQLSSLPASTRHPANQKTDPTAALLRGGLDDYAHLIAELRSFLDHVAAARPDEETSAQLRTDLAAWRERLVDHVVAERDQLFGRRHDLVGLGQTMAPASRIVHLGADDIAAVVTFGRYYLGGNGAVHGGALPLVFDSVLGKLANSGGRVFARTAYLRVDYRAVTPVGRELQITGRIEQEEGRKRLIRAQLLDGGRVCADAESLFVALRPGQP